MRPASITVAILAALTLFHGCDRPAYATAHPTNAGGFVTDGTPQLDDGHCVGTPDQQTACKIARRPECRDWTRAMDRQTAMGCWAAELNDYPWPAQPMFDALFCESKGEEQARNGRYLGLLQSDHGTGDALADFHDAYYDKWVGQGASAWAGTYGRYCAD